MAARLRQVSDVGINRQWPIRAWSSLCTALSSSFTRSKRKHYPPIWTVGIGFRRTMQRLHLAPAKVCAPHRITLNNRHCPPFSLLSPSPAVTDNLGLEPLLRHRPLRFNIFRRSSIFSFRPELDQAAIMAV
jgi:hypothetical protein